MDPVVLVTGASAGLGWEIARQLLERPYRLVLTARETSLPRFERLGVRPGERVLLAPLDVIDAGQREAVVELAERRFGGVDVLINNAGVSYRSVVEHVTEQERLEQMGVNFRGPMELVRLVLPGMRAKRRGRIINISSVGGMMAMPTMAVYSASKFALEGASEALWYEVRPWNIRVTLVQPGFIHSDAFRKVRYTSLSRTARNDPDDPYHAHYRFMEPFIEKLMDRVGYPPEKVAAKVLKVIESPNPPLRVPATPDAVFFSMLRRLLPRRVYHEVLYRGLPHWREWGPAQRGVRRASEARAAAGEG